MSLYVAIPGEEFVDAVPGELCIGLPARALLDAAARLLLIRAP